MRDIRQDLRERIDALVVIQQELQKQVGDLEQQKKLLNALLQAEEQRWPASSSSMTAGPMDLGAAHRHDNHGLPDLILDIMSNGESWLGGSIAAAAEMRGHKFGTSAPGRAIHFTLLGLLKQGKVQSAGLGKWKLKKQKQAVGSEDAA